jgi:hypothetical protein
MDELLFNKDGFMAISSVVVRCGTMVCVLDERGCQKAMVSLPEGGVLAGYTSDTFSIRDRNGVTMIYDEHGCFKSTAY